MAGVNMRLEAGAIRCVLRFDPDMGDSNLALTYSGRELHWHKTSEVSLSIGVLERTMLTYGAFAQWAYVIKVRYRPRLVSRLYVERHNAGIYPNLRGGPRWQKLFGYSGKESWS